LETIEKEKLLVVGSSGFLGNSLVNFYHNSAIFGISALSRGEIVLTLKGKLVHRHKQLSFTNLARVIEQVNPQTIFNASGLVGDRECKLFPEIAREANVNLPSMLAKITNELGIQFIHFSTDAVFGQNQKKRDEGVAPDPDTVYGITKLQGEVEAKTIFSNSLIIRTNFVGVDYLGQRGLFNYFSNSFDRKVRINGYSNVVFNPISIRFLSKNVDILRKKRVAGIFHLAGNTKLSKYEFGRLILKSMLEEPFNSRNFISSQSADNDVRLDMTLETPKMNYLDLQHGDLGSEVERMCIERKRRLVEN
jgi:dTDP-4-dehydrorhamnose reductase